MIASAATTDTKDTKVSDTPRRTFLKVAGIAGASILAEMTGDAEAQQAPRTSVPTVQTPVLSIAYEDSGNANGFPVILLHGFPDDARAYDGVVPPLTKAGYRALVPYLRGYGATRFRDSSAPRMVTALSKKADSRADRRVRPK